MRIALTGSGGTGKTVTAMELARITGLPHVKSQARVVFEAMGITSMENDPKQDPEKFLECQRRILEQQIEVEKHATERSPKGWIAERSVLDTAAYCSWWSSAMPLTGGKWRERHEAIKNECLRVVNTAQLHAASKPYDAVFLMPYGHIRLSGDLHRSGDAMYQRAIDLMISGLTFRQLADRATLVPQLDMNETGVAMWILKRCNAPVDAKAPQESVVSKSEKILSEPVGCCSHCAVLGHRPQAMQETTPPYEWRCERCGKQVADPGAV